MSQTISCFCGDENNIKRVYSPAIIQQLVTEAGLNPDSVLFSSINEHTSIAQKASYLFSTWGMPALSEKVIGDVFPNLKAVFYAAGSVQSFARPFLNQGIRVFSAWGANAVPVAEYTVGQILLANKGFFQSSAYNKSGNIPEACAFSNMFPGNYQCKVGIIGAGMIGKLVIRLLKSFDLDVMVFDPFLSDECAQQLGVTKCTIEQLFSECQTISNHLANNPQTVGILNYALFSRMRDYTTFLNTGRGAQVNETDLVQLLEKNPTITAILDVTYPEPPEQGHPFYTLPNVFLTPHIAGSKGDEVVRMAQYMLDEYRLLTSGLPVQYEVTLKMLETMA